MLELNKNLLINGNHYYAARRPSGTATPTTSYQYLTTDRFCQKIAGTITTPTVEAAADLGIAKSPWCSKYTGITAAGSSISEQQRIESDFGLELIGDYISYLGYVASTSYQKATVNIGYASAKDNHASQVLLFTEEFTITTNGAVNELKWEKISSLSSLISTGLYVEIVLSNPSNTSTSSTHRIGGQTLVRSHYCPTETLLHCKTQIDEGRACQRYVRRLNGTCAFQASNTSTVESIIVLTDLRAAPTASLTASAKIEDTNTSSYTQSSTSVTLTSMTIDGGKIGLGNFTGLTTGKLYFLWSDGGKLFLNAEL
jgi:hypothetical protein